MSDIDPEHPEVQSLLKAAGITHADLTKLVNNAPSTITHPAVSTATSTSAATPASTTTPATSTTTVPTLDTSVQQALAQSGPELQYMFQEDNAGNPTVAGGQAQQVVTPASQSPTPQSPSLDQQQYNELLAQTVPGAFNG
jgi:hypothetical protein